MTVERFDTILDRAMIPMETDGVFVGEMDSTKPFYSPDYGVNAFVNDIIGDGVDRISTALGSDSMQSHAENGDRKGLARSAASAEVTPSLVKQYQHSGLVFEKQGRTISISDHVGRLS
jgi:hypothetical protein